MYLGGALTMIFRCHHLRASLNKNATLEVRDMILPVFAGGPVLRTIGNKEVRV